MERIKMLGGDQTIGIYTSHGACSKGANPIIARNADLSCMSLEREDLSGAILTGACLIGANLEGADLRRAILSRSDLSGASLKGANLTEAIMDNAVLEGADLSGTNLRGASFINADLTGACLRDACLRQAHLQDTNLAWVDISGADFADAYTARLNLRGCQLAGVRNAAFCRPIVGEIMLRGAGDDERKLLYASLVSFQENQCWDHWRQVYHEASRDLKRWIVQVFRDYPESGCLQALRLRGQIGNYKKYQAAEHVR